MLIVFKWSVSKLPLLLFVLLPLAFVIYSFVDTFLYTKATYAQLESVNSFAYHFGANIATYLPSAHTGTLLLCFVSVFCGCIYSTVKQISNR